MREEEKNYVDFLSGLSQRQLTEQVGDKWIQVSEQAEKYVDVVKNMTNNYVFAPDDVLDIICEDAKLTRKFRLFALSWIEAMGMRYKMDYWDMRDKAAVEYCHDVAKMESFRNIYSRLLKSECADIQKLHDRRQDRVLDSYTSRVVENLHPTLRQSYTGFVLSFLLRDRYLIKIKAEAEKMQLLQSGQVKVRFMMI